MKRSVRTALWVALAVIASCAAEAGFYYWAGKHARYPLAGSAEHHLGLRGAFHVHSDRSSDGKGTQEEIAAAAAKAGLDFVVLTDHNVDAFDPPVFESGVLLISAEEVSTHAGHLVALGLPRALTSEERNGDDVVATVRALGGGAVLAHPFQLKSPWTDWTQAKGALGLETYSEDTMFRRAMTRPLSVLWPAGWAFLANPVHGLEMIAGPEREATEELLELSTDEARLALCGLDAHGRPPYADVFRTLSMYLPAAGPDGLLKLDPEPATGQAQVVAALTSGAAYCAFHGLADGGGFAIGGVGPRRTVKRGDVLRVQLPRDVPPGARLHVAGGAHSGPDGQTVVADGPGPFQVEVWVPVPGFFLGNDAERPWLVASPIRVE